MSDVPSSQQLIAIKGQRDQTITALCDHFAQDRLTLEEFERRLDVATRALTVPELDALLADLPTAPATSEPNRPVAVTFPASAARGQQTLVAVMGGVERRGKWVPAQKTFIVAFMGGGILDFREVQLPPGETRVTILAIMGGVEIIVPPDMQIDVAGIALMGGFSHSQTQHGEHTAGGPVLKIDGVAVMGGVDVQVRLPGESDSDARQRIGDVRRQLREERRRLRDEVRRLR